MDGLYPNMQHLGRDMQQLVKVFKDRPCYVILLCVLLIVFVQQRPWECGMFWHAVC